MDITAWAGQNFGIKPQNSIKNIFKKCAYTYGLEKGANSSVYSLL